MGCMCAMAVTSHIFSSRLVSGVSTLKVGGNGHISAQMYVLSSSLVTLIPGYECKLIFISRGDKINHYGWGLMAASCVVAFVETIMVYREYKKRRAARRSGSPTGRGGRISIVGGGPKSGGIYQHLAPDGKEGLHGSSQIELIRSSGPMSRDPSPMRGYGPRESNIMAQESAYEPMRHRNVG